MVCLTTRTIEQKTVLELGPEDHGLYFQSRTALLLHLVLLGPLKGKVGGT